MANIKIAGKSLSVTGHALKLGALNAHVSGATATFKPAAGSDRAIGFHVALTGASLSTVDAFLGNRLAANVTADGTLTQASFDPAETLARTLDQWRAAGGHVDLADLSVERGETKFAAKGKLTLNSAHQLEGRLDTRSVGFEPVLRRLGVNPALISGASLLSALLGGHGTAQAAGPQPLSLPVGFEDGQISIGPVITSIRLPPLY